MDRCIGVENNSERIDIDCKDESGDTSSLKDTFMGVE